MFEIKTHHNGWGVFTPKWCDGRVPVFSSFREDGGMGIYDCMHWVKEQKQLMFLKQQREEGEKNAVSDI